MFLRETEYDDFTGVTKRWYIDDDKIICKKTMDERPNIDFAKRLCNETIDESFVNDSRRMVRMATLPVIVVDKILKDHGLNLMQPMTPQEQRRLNRVIETEYPWCKTHTKRLWRPVKSGTK